VDITKEKAYLNQKWFQFIKQSRHFLPGLKPGNGDNGEGALPYGLGAGGGPCPSVLS
jgi:hypothetical protein